MHKPSMGGNRRGAKDSGRVTNFASQNLLSLREMGSGRKQTSTGSGSVKSRLKMQHLQKLALWATGEASVPSLGAFFGHRLAVSGEALGIPPDPSFFYCQRCESILQPGYNCTVRIEKNRSKARRNKPNISTQNSVVYLCQFCSHKNMRRGTSKAHMKEICPPKSKPSSRLQTVKSIAQKDKSTGSTGEVDRIDDVDSTAMVKSDKQIEIAQNSASIPSLAVAKDIPTAMESASMEKVNEPASPAIAGVISGATSLATPLVREGTTLLDSKRRIRKKPGPKKEAESENACTTVDVENSVSKSRKRRRNKSTSLREIAESSVREKLRNIAANISIPFPL